MEKVETITNIIGSFGVLIALIVLIIEILKNTESKQFESFTNLLSIYDGIVEKRRDRYKTIKEVVSKNPKTADEMHDKQNSLSYLILRLEQKEAFYAIEHELLDLEIRSLCYLNELCRMARRNRRSKRILFLKESNELTYYKTRLNDLLKIYEAEKTTVRFFKPQYNFLEKINVDKYFDQPE